MKCFVYGTLKRGFGNNSILRGSKLIGAGQSTKPFVMYGGGFPYAVDKENSEDEALPIVGEVYDVVDSSVEQDLDWLEGVKHDHYYRKIISVEMDSGEAVEAVMYVASQNVSESLVGASPCVSVVHKGGFVYDWER